MLIKRCHVVSMWLNSFFSLSMSNHDLICSSGIYFLFHPETLSTFSHYQYNGITDMVFFPNFLVLEIIRNRPYSSFI